MKDYHKEFSELVTYLGQLEFSIISNEEHLSSLKSEKKDVIRKLKIISQNIEENESTIKQNSD